MALRNDWTNDSVSLDDHPGEHNEITTEINALKALAGEPLQFGFYSNWADPTPIPFSVGPTESFGTRKIMWLAQWTEHTDDNSAKWPADQVGNMDQVKTNASTSGRVVLPHQGWLNVELYVDIDVSGCAVGDVIWLNAGLGGDHDGSWTLTADQIASGTINYSLREGVSLKRLRNKNDAWAPAVYGPDTAKLSYVDWTVQYVNHWDAGTVVKLPLREVSVTVSGTNITVTWDTTKNPELAGQQIYVQAHGLGVASYAARVTANYDAGQAVLTRPAGRWEIRAVPLSGGRTVWQHDQLLSILTIV